MTRKANEGMVAAWLGLICAGTATVTFNVWHATHSGMEAGLGIIEGVAPVALAMIVSHLVATYSGGKILRAVTFAVMVGAMVLSVGATGAVVRPAAKSLWPLFGAVVDTAALACLQVLLSLKARAARTAQERAEAEADAADERTALRAETEALRAALETAQTARQEAENRAAQATAQADFLARKLDAQRARKAAAKKSATPSRKTAQPDRATEVPDDVDARREALAILANEPGISGAKLGPRVGMSARWGQLIKQELAPAPPRDVVDGEGDDD